MPTTNLSTHSGTEEERAQKFKIQLHELKLRAEAQLKDREARAQAAEQEASFVSLSQEGTRNRMVDHIKGEFINVLKVRKVILKHLRS